MSASLIRWIIYTSVHIHIDIEITHLHFPLNCFTYFTDSHYEVYLSRDKEITPCRTPFQYKDRLFAGIRISITKIRRSFYLHNGNLYFSKTFSYWDCPTGLALTHVWISHVSPIIVWDEITYPFPNVNGYTVEYWWWIINFYSPVIADVITYPCWDQS